KKWISDISHELRTPVAVLRAEIEAVQDGVRQVSDETVDSLHKEILRLTRLINDLHDLSLSDKGALSYHYEKIDINEIIKILIDSEKDKIGKNNLEMEYSSFFTLKPIYISGDEGRITQLFTNLLNNTRLYTNSGGKLQINGEVVDNDLVIIWSDSEPGVSTEQLDKLFDRLYRVETSRNRNTGGSGLGLAICKNIVEAHQGTIVANHSKIGGIEINISLPIWRK
ncbi:MAG: two-component sensor histidine kinase, partial [Gammaproteobacteria bacterium]|nr:two-component sensor histidine kinase [Gammaproteobacteria bacterium]